MHSFPTALDVRIHGWMATAMFVVAEADSLVVAYTGTRHSPPPFAFFAYFLPLLALFPWLAYRKLSTLLSRTTDSLDTKTKSTLSLNLSMATVMAYVLFTFALTLPHLLKGN